MKKLITFTAITMILTSLFAYTNNTKPEDVYTYNGETNVNIDNRNFKLEDIPDNLAEEIVVNNFLYSITADFDSMLDILANIETHKISIENEEKHFNEDIYIRSYIIHEISTLSKDEYDKKELENGGQNTLYYYGWHEIIEKHNLVEYEIINVNFTQKHSNKSKELIPQWGDGTYSRSFIVGKPSDDTEYKIYDFGMM